MSHSASPSSYSSSSAASAGAVAFASVPLSEPEQKQSDQLHEARIDATESFCLAIENVTCNGCVQVASAKSEGVTSSDFYLLASVAYPTANLLLVCRYCSVRMLHHWTMHNNEYFIHTIVPIGWRNGADATYMKTGSNRNGRNIQKPVLKTLLTDRHSKGHGIRFLSKFLNDFGVSSLRPVEENLMSVVDGGCATSFLALAQKPYQHRSTAAAVALRETPADLLEQIYTLCLPFVSSTKRLNFEEPVYLVQLLSWILNCTSVDQVWGMLCLHFRVFKQLFLRSGISLPAHISVTSFVDCLRCIYRFNKHLDETLRSIRFAGNDHQQNAAKLLPVIDVSSPSSPPMSEASTLPSTPLTPEAFPFEEEVESPDSPVAAFLVDMEVDANAPVIGLISPNSSSLSDEIGLTQMELHFLESGSALQGLVPAAATQSNPFSHLAQTASLSSSSQVASRKRSRSDSTRLIDSEEALRQDKRRKESTEEGQIPELPVLSPTPVISSDVDFIWPCATDSLCSPPSLFSVNLTTPASPFHPALPESSDMSDLAFGFPQGFDLSN